MSIIQVNHISQVEAFIQELERCTLQNYVINKKTKYFSDESKYIH